MFAIRLSGASRKALPCSGFEWVTAISGSTRYVKRYLELCPGKAMTLEIIVTGPRKYPYFDPKFWDGYRNVPASNFARFVSLVDKGSSPARRSACS